MTESFLLSRLLLRFDAQWSEVSQDLSAATFTPDGSLWVASDETRSIERLSPIEPYIFGNHQHFPLKHFISLPDPDGEIDIEGMDFSNHYLWLIGSHSPKRKNIKGKNPEKDIQKLAKVETEPNRYLLARIPVVGNELFQVFSNPDNPNEQLRAAYLQRTEKGDLLIDILQEDAHLGPYVASSLPSKENGFDIEGLAVQGNKVFIGLRGPVLRGWAIILELEVEEGEPGILQLKKVGSQGKQYKKHFVNLNGLGIRELCLDGKDLIILAGPTMAVEGSMRVFSLKNVLKRSDSTLSDQKDGELEVLFDLPFIFGVDHAEGLSLCTCLGQSKALLVVYDSPSSLRKLDEHTLFADVFRLK